MNVALTQALLVGAGGFIGAILRYGLSGLVHRLAPMSSFPWGTLVVNVSGCLVIGVLTGLAESRQAMGPELRMFLLLGLLGGFTTFSTFGYETLALARSGSQADAIMNISMHLFLGLTAVWIGFQVSRIW